MESILGIEINELDIQSLPLVETVLTTFNYFQNNSNVKLLCCSVLISFSQFSMVLFFSLCVDHCIEDAKKFGVIEKMVECLHFEENPEVVAMEIAVISAFGVYGSFLY